MKIKQWYSLEVMDNILDNIFEMIFIADYQANRLLLQLL